MSHSCNFSNLRSSQSQIIKVQENKIKEKERKDMPQTLCEGQGVFVGWGAGRMLLRGPL